MSKSINDEEHLAVLTIGYNELVVPFEAAVLIMEGLRYKNCGRFESKWINEKRESWEVLEDTEVSIKSLKPERLALAKLNTQAYADYKAQQDKNEQQKGGNNI